MSDCFLVYKDDAGKDWNVPMAYAVAHVKACQNCMDKNTAAARYAQCLHACAAFVKEQTGTTP